MLPGVTVEAASPALIEKIRTATTDSAGEYKITNLVPGVYTVTFSLQGFGTFRREGIELTTNFTAQVNADMSALFVVWAFRPAHQANLKVRTTFGV